MQGVDGGFVGTTLRLESHSISKWPEERADSHSDSRNKEMAIVTEVEVGSFVGEHDLAFCR